MRESRYEEECFGGSVEWKKNLVYYVELCVVVRVYIYEFTQTAVM
jgi:hypothetical protein